jgi:hypothetical protein
MRNGILMVAATLCATLAAASDASAHRVQDHSSSIDWQCENIMADPQGAAGGGAEYCATTWVHAPLFPYHSHGFYAQPVYADPVAACAARFRSYNPATHTYIGHDGHPHHCP